MSEKQTRGESDGKIAKIKAAPVGMKVSLGRRNGIWRSIPGGNATPQTSETQVTEARMVIRSTTEWPMEKPV